MKRPALDPAELPVQDGSTYPDEFKPLVAGRRRRRLGDALGLTDFGVNLTELAPGAQSALRHWHHREDEFIWVVDGELTLVTDAGPQILRAGQCAGFPKGVPDGHCLVNHSQAPAVYLEMGSRHPEEVAEYPDVDLRYRRPEGFTRKDGSKV
ncbi:MAG: cupin domain-containing protein [Solirubrobacterales bacterium]